MGLPEEPAFDGSTAERDAESKLVGLVKRFQPASMLLVRSDPPGELETLRVSQSWDRLLAPTKIQLTELGHLFRPESIGDFNAEVACLLIDADGIGAGESHYLNLQSTIATWRDRWTKALWVGLRTSDRIMVGSMMRALGFSSLPESGRRNKCDSTSDAELLFFAYSLENYKSIPEWLNARYWAHPERWDLEQEG